MKRWLVLAIVLSPLSVSAVGPEVPTKGVICWDKSPAADLKGYEWYIVQIPGKPTTGIVDAGLVVSTPPGCPTGQVGVLRDQTGKTDGQYYAGAIAYDTAGNKSSPSEFAYFLNSQPPVPLTGLGVH